MAKRVSPSCSAAMTLRVVVAGFVGRIDQHQRAARRRRQQCLEGVETVGGGDADAPALILEVVLQDFAVAAVEFEQAQAILRAQGLQGEPGGAGIKTQVAVRIAGAHLIDIVGQRGGQILAGPQLADAALVFLQLGRIARVQCIQTRARMGVDDPERFVFLPQVTAQLDEQKVLQHIGVIAGMKGVAVAQHGRIEMGGRPECCIFWRISPLVWLIKAPNRATCGAVAEIPDTPIPAHARCRASRRCGQPG